MTKIKTAQAWGDLHHGTGFLRARTDNDQGIIIGRIPVVIVHGLTEAEVHESAALLEKSREVCEWPKAYHQTKDGLLRIKTGCGLTLRIEADKTRPCWCGRKVEVK